MPEIELQTLAQILGEPKERRKHERVGIKYFRFLPQGAIKAVDEFVFF